ncbi:hypothetical protein WI87_28650 [Burkholderia ubonensis]|uniref:hypothetical protein n=1 Tax=Burkholderia ubonensis TaxID=101571 RepID=UPI00075A18A8|nr:hypothetical protein [Burkholderia ubonensis]KVD67340.1 hypothetical protein WI87_28650 [Burkholderia ubonensis]OJA64473.1 hypothetical protein BGV68_01305 [Burkholderia ubonensis]
MDVINIGAAAFGAVVGWMAGHTTRRAKSVDVKWLGAMVFAIFGSAVAQGIGHLGGSPSLFGWYGIALAVLFFINVLNNQTDIDLGVWQLFDNKETVRYEGTRAECESWMERLEIGNGASIRRDQRG